jgi:(2Fe-2S) ferredoxin
MSKFTHHIFVCGNQRKPGHSRGSCNSDGKDKLRSALKSELKRLGLKATVRANAAGCLDVCEVGPVIVIYPQAIWYGRVEVKDAARIVEQTILRGEILPDLLLSPAELGCHPVESSSCASANLATEVTSQPKPQE